MKLAKVEIDNCFECPFISRDEDYCFEVHRPLSITFDLPGDTKFPEWCPLEDTEEA